MNKGRIALRESIRLEAEGLRLAGLALEPLDWNEKRRVLVMICDRWSIDPTKLGSVNADGSSTGGRG